MFPPRSYVHMFSTVIELLSVLKDLSIHKHQFHWNIIPLHCSYHLSCQSRCCLQWSYEGNIEVECFLALQTGLVRMKEKDVKGGLLSNQPFRSHPSHANNLLDAFHQVFGDITAFHKTVVTFALLLTPLSALHHWLPLSAHSVFQHKVNCTSLPMAAALSVSACVCVWIHVWLLLMCQGCRHVSMF